MSFDYVLLFIVVLLIIVISSIILYSKKNVNIRRIFDDAVYDSQYSHTEFIIYDRSSDAICNRLIVVKPFDWYIWACRDELYVLNPEGGVQCSADSVGAVRIFKDSFYEVCVMMSFQNILDLYMRPNVKTKRRYVPYSLNDIGSTSQHARLTKENFYEIENDINKEDETKITFTIFSALNELVKKWIKFNPHDENKDNKSKHGVKRSTTDTETENDRFTISHDDFTNETDKRIIATKLIASDSDTDSDTNSDDGNNNLSNILLNSEKDRSKNKKKRSIKSKNKPRKNLTNVDDIYATIGLSESASLKYRREQQRINKISRLKIDENTIVQTRGTRLLNAREVVNLLKTKRGQIKIRETRDLKTKKYDLEVSEIEYSLSEEAKNNYIKNLKYMKNERSEYFKNLTKPTFFN